LLVSPADAAQDDPQHRMMPANSEASVLRMEFNNGGVKVIKSHNDGRAGSVPSK
jgi:hypothetical protein